ncbi:MAG TPA: class I SAM-dependent methyltransferase [Prolixibacteraceae bacterium]|nr:class I SAM-dependent methyltransferase [Prolixibacteraceae bacterium]
MDEKNVFDIKAKTWDDNPVRMKLVSEVWDEIVRHVDFAKVSRALDYGCGTGLLGFKAIKDVDVMTFCDTSDGMLEQVKQKKAFYGTENATVLKADFIKDALPEESIDLIMSMLVLHHVHELNEIIARFAEALNTGGYFCWIDLESEDGSFHGNNDGVAHLGFSRSGTEKLLQDNGFEIVYHSNRFYMEKTTGDNTKRFPVFLLIGKKQS